MKAFLVVNLAIVAVHAVGAGAALGFGRVVQAAGAGDSIVAWMAVGILSTAAAIGFAARLTLGGSK